MGLEFAPTDRRRSVRHRRNSGAQIHLGSSSSRCILVDESAGGALIRIGTDYPLPLRFDLQRGMAQRPIPVQVVWQYGAMAGIRVDPQPFWRNVLTWITRKRVRAGRISTGISGRL